MLAVVGVCAACKASIDTRATDAPDVKDSDAPSDAGPLGPWGAPEPVTAPNSVDIETDPTIRGDGLELIFSSNRPGGPGNFDIYRALRTTTSESFGAAMLVAELSTVDGDQACELSADGLTIYFKRAGDIYRATRPDLTSPFGNIVLDVELSSGEPDTNPAISGDGLVASVTREGMSPNREIYIYTRPTKTAAWSAARHATELSTPASDSGAGFDRDGLTVFFHSDRVLGGDLLDIFVATRASTGEPFGNVVPVTEVNTMGSEGDPSVTPDLRIMVMDRGGDVFLATR